MKKMLFFFKENMLFFFLDKAKDIELQDIGVKIKNQGKYLNYILIVLYTIYYWIL